VPAPRIPASAWEELEELERLSDEAVKAIGRGCFAEAERRSLELERRFVDYVDQLHREGLWAEVRRETEGSLALSRRGIRYIEQNPGSFDEASRQWILQMIARLDPSQDPSR